jgi:hypothetical protein
MRVLILALPLLLLACAKEPVPVPPQPAPASAPAAVTAPKSEPQAILGWEDAPHSPGDWIYRRDARGSVALFGPGGGDARFIVRCDLSAGRIFLSRLGGLAAGQTGSMEIRSTSGVKRFAARSNGDTPSYIAIELPPRDPHLDAMAFSRGRFLVSVKGIADLIIPNWPEMTRVIEDCRS